MTEFDVKAAVLDALHRIAPEVDLATIRADRRLRDQVDIDSIDFLNLLVDVNQTLGVEVPESEYGRLATLDDMVAYLSTRLGRGSEPGGTRS